MANSISITFGRNQKSAPDMPLSQLVWDSFKFDVCHILKSLADDSNLGIVDLSTFEGENSYNGVKETSATVHLVTEQAFAPEYLPDSLFERIERLKVIYDQDTIAFSVGTSRLV